MSSGAFLMTGNGERFMPRMKRTRAGATLLLAVLIALALTPAAFAITQVGVTTQSDTPAGVRNVFTYQAYTAKGDSVTELDLEFPKGTEFDPAAIRFSVLHGLERTPVEAKPTISGSTIRFTIAPAVAPERLIQVVFNNVMTAPEGGDFRIGGSYVTDGATKTLPAAEFSLKSASPSERLSAWLNDQAWVAKWNSVPFLNAFFKPQMIVATVPVVFAGWLLSIVLVLLSYASAIPLGLGTAFVKMSKIPPLRWLASAYINVIRGTPLFLQIYIGFFGLPLIGIHVPDFFLAIIVLAFNSAAYMAEIFRAGIQSINKGQFEAASSLGMTYPQAMAFVIIPQTVRRILPTMTSEFILLFKDTALLSAVGVFELMMFAKNFAANTGNVTSYMVAAGYYLILTIPLINWVGSLEARLAVSEGGHMPNVRLRRRWQFWRPAAVAVDPYRATAPELIEDRD